MEYFKYGTTHGNLDGLINGMLQGKRHVTVLESEVRVVDGKVNISKVESVIWVL